MTKAREMEYRNVGRKGLELRELASTADGVRFTGYASVFNYPYEVHDFSGRFVETVRPGAFRQTLSHRGGKVPIFGNHDPAEHIGYGLSAVEDKRGLLVEGEILMDFEEGRKHVTLMKQAHKIGVPMGLSMGFQAIKDDWRGKEERELLEVALHHWTPTPVPANDAAAVQSFRSQLRSFLSRGIISADANVSALLGPELNGPEAAAMPSETDPLHSISQALQATLDKLRA